MNRSDKSSRDSAPGLEWYFSHGYGNLLTIPIFLILLSLFLFSIWTAFVKGMALIMVIWAVHGGVAVLILFMLVWILSPLVLGPPALFFFALTFTPVAWSNTSSTGLRRVLNIMGLLLAAGLAAWLMNALLVWSMGWVADHDPCAASEVGVIGTIPPSNCSATPESLGLYPPHGGRDR